VVASLLALCLAIPVLAIAGLLIKATSPGPVIFAQKRVGRGEKLFTCYKLRTMRSDADELPTHEVGVRFVTPLGRFLRRSKLDELPQLWNVLRGEMSLVGPRPCLPTQTMLIELRRERGIFGLRPGITGIAQVKGIDMSDPQRLVECESEYLRRQSVLDDFAILVRTLLPKCGGGATA
jgi:O-antigen biosynthesis protein WbqP